MKRKRKMIGWIITLVILAGLGIWGGIGWSKLMKEHEEVNNLPLNAVDFEALVDGNYQGYYEGGRFKWRENTCEVTVAEGKVSDIKLISSKEIGPDDTNLPTLYERVISGQTLQVDTISGATLTSKAHLQCVENALLQAQQN